MINVVTMEGRLGNEPEIRYSEGTDSCISTFSLACQKDFVKQGEERTADFIQCVAFNKIAKACKDYLKKGSHVIVVGRLVENNYTKDGKKYYGHRIVIEKLRFLETKETKEDFKPVKEEETPFKEDQTTGDGQKDAANG